MGGSVKVTSGFGRYAVSFPVVDLFVKAEVQPVMILHTSSGIESIGIVSLVSPFPDSSESYAVDNNPQLNLRQIGVA